MEWWLILIIVLSVLIAFGTFLYLFRLYMRQGRYKKQNRIDHNVVIITGANTGIGKETAIDLARRGARVYIACRDIKRGLDALDDIRRHSRSDFVYFLQLDLASFDSIRNFVQRFREHEHKLHILINNAGLLAKNSNTKDGFEMTIGVNHLGHFLLTHLLLDLLIVSAPSRIVNVSSLGHKFAKLEYDDFDSNKKMSVATAYAKSKLMNILFTRKLAQKLIAEKVSVNSCHPGCVRTEIARNFSTYDFLTTKILGEFLKSPYEGAQTQIRIAVDPELENVTGKYFVDCKPASVSKEAKNDEKAEWLYRKSYELVGLEKIEL
ncbi:hypothetical protein PVAND_006801 [Polypedilum vanderplanki]|uniref:Uncharacterized protein n=1 Tax=Polypedilum vanderplanki TaxID=319348 RepID=A0A9J6C537_POLVA|nr:hypothetical protein PVAND_006801 [Polypedilum vanderplanki]